MRTTGSWAAVGPRQSRPPMVNEWLAGGQLVADEVGDVVAVHWPERASTIGAQRGSTAAAAAGLPPAGPAAAVGAAEGGEQVVEPALPVAEPPAQDGFAPPGSRL